MTKAATLRRSNDSSKMEGYLQKTNPHAQKVALVHTRWETAYFHALSTHDD